MILSVLFFIILPLLPILNKLLKNKKNAVIIYYTIIFLFILIFSKTIINNPKNIVPYLMSAGIIFFPLLDYLPESSDKNIFKLLKIFLYFIIYPIGVALKAFIVYKHGWNSEGAFVFFIVIDVFFLFYLLPVAAMIPLFFLQEKFKTKY